MAYRTWAENPCVIQNPDYPHPRGYPKLVQEGEPVSGGENHFYKLKVGDRVRIRTVFYSYLYSIDYGMIVNTRTIFNDRKHIPLQHVMLDTALGKWIHSSAVEQIYEHRRNNKDLVWDPERLARK